MKSLLTKYLAGSTDTVSMYSLQENLCGQQRHPVLPPASRDGCGDVCDDADPVMLPGPGDWDGL